MKKTALVLFVVLLVMTFSSCNANTQTPDNNLISMNDFVTTTKQNTMQNNISLEVQDEVVIEGKRLTMDQYVAGVIAVELQNWFKEETFKAFAIAARTNAVKRLNAGKELINSTAFQCYYSVDDLKEIYGKSWQNYYDKFYGAAVSTHNQIIVDSSDNLIDAMYHAISSGKTEDSKYVTGYAKSYLKSVDSPWDKNVSCYEKVRLITYEELQEYGFNRPVFEIKSYTDTGRPYIYEVCGKEYTATELMYKLHLKSAVFEVEYEESGISFTTYGFGHNVGMSAYGAEGMAKEGYTYIQILNHFYTDINVVTY